MTGNNRQAGLLPQPGEAELPLYTGPGTGRGVEGTGNSFAAVAKPTHRKLEREPLLDVLLVDEGEGMRVLITAQLQHEPPVHFGFNFIDDRPAVYCGVRFRF